MPQPDDLGFRHTPYDGSSRPFSVGLRPIEERDWLEPDIALDTQLAIRSRLLVEAGDSVLRAEAGTREAQNEVLRLILGNLETWHGATHKVEADHVRLVGTGRVIDLGDAEPIASAGRIVQEDLVLMRPAADGYRLAAACLCFPSSWSLAEKFGQSMADIHRSVPGFNDGSMGRIVARLFENLTADQIVCRYNWSVYGDGELFHPEPKSIGMGRDLMGPESLFLRVERQTLRRLRGSGDILFTIKIHHDPLAVLHSHPNRASIASGLCEQLLALDASQVAYKGLAKVRDRLAEALRAFACG